MSTQNFIAELRWRGLVQAMTDGLEEALLADNSPKRGYIGFDPTAPSLTIGNFVQIATLRRFQQAGHQPIVLLGGATGRIGDPSGRDTERSLLTLNILEQNIAHQQSQFSKFLDFSENSPNRALVINNWDFYKDMNALTFLRDIGKNITVNYMLAKDSVRNRMDSGISFTEFSYQIIQGYDFEHLHKNHDCLLQMGGGDQWGNITTGLEFVRKAGGKAHALCTPLLTKADGKKFGKSESGNLWLDPIMTTPYQFYQYWLGSNINDLDLPNLYRVLSFRSQAEIEQIEAEFAQDPITRRRLLAEELTTLIHDAQALQNVQYATQVVHNPKLSIDFLQSLSADVWEAVAVEIGYYTINAAQLADGISLVDWAVEQKIFSSKGEARKAIQNNAVALNTEKISQPDFMITAQHVIKSSFMLLQNGKKNKYVLQVK
jgi:tyrosyl-tRNA synthetase